MNRLQTDRFTMLLMAGFLAAMAGGAAFFVMGMGQTTYLVSDGMRLGTVYLDKPRYDMHLQGLIFSVAFLAAGGLLLLLVLLPNENAQGGAQREAPPQPRPRPEPAAGAPQPVARPAAPQPAAQASPLSIEGTEGEPAASELAPGPAATARRPTAPLDIGEDEATAAENLPAVDFGDDKSNETGEEDVVYGNGRITEDAVWEFIQLYPDSAVKFLYRKTLDNKTLAPAEDDIYRVWENRGMSRAKVREIVLEVMRWQSLPDSFPHEIWRALRDQIYEMRNR